MSRAINPASFPDAVALRLSCRAGFGSVTHAVGWAWNHRWSPIPSAWPDLRAWGLAQGLNRDELRYLAWVGARRAHFAFAHATMVRLCDDALEEYPGDELLTALRHAGHTMRPGCTESWSELAAMAHAGAAEGIARHIYFTCANYAIDVPEHVLRDALALAEALRADGDVVAAYRMMSLLRRLGHFRQAILAGDAVNELLVAGSTDSALADHLSERLLTERHLCIELLASQDAQVRLSTDDAD